MAAPRDHGPARRTPPTRLSSERAVRRIVDATASVVGDEFMTLVVASCATTLGVPYAFITETTLDPAVNRLVAFWDDGILRRDIAYPIASTLTGAIQHTGTVMYGRDVATRFPAFPWLSQHGVESFVGVPLRAAGGDVIGQFGVLGRESDTDVYETEEVLRAIAPRLERELERDRLIRELRQREQMLQLVVEHANDVLFRLERRPRTGLAYISPAVEQLSGYPSDAFMRDRLLFLRVIDPDDRSSVARKLLREHRGRISARWRRADRTTIWVEYSDAQTVDDAGTVLAIDGVIRDVTERVALEQDLRAAKQRERDVITAMPDMVFRIGADGIYREYFDAEDKRPLVPPAEFLGRHVAEILPEDLAVQLLRAIRAAVETDATQRVEYPLQVDDEERYYEARIVPANHSEVLAFVRDFTAERRLEREDERRVAREELETRIESKMTDGTRYGLTFRELTVLHHVSSGLADKEIAEALGISAYTVNKHVASILSKMDAPSRTAAGVRAVREGLLT